MSGVDQSEAVGQPMPPWHILQDELVAAERGEMPDLSTDAVLAMLQLDGPDADGRGLPNRLTGSDQPAKISKVAQCLSGMLALTMAANERTANPAQEELAATLGAVVCEQIIREGGAACTITEILALSSTRPDIISDDIKALLPHRSSTAEEAQAAFHASLAIAAFFSDPDLLRSISGRVVFFEAPVAPGSRSGLTVYMVETLPEDLHPPEPDDQ